MMVVSRSILLLCVLTGLASAQLSSANKRNEPQSQLQAQTCGKLLTRKEWRTLTSGEKAEWVGAVKVCPLSPLRASIADVEQCMANIRHERLSLTQNQTVLEGKRSLYDDFSYSHASMEHSSHRNAYFLPWRAFDPSPSPPTHCPNTR
jgi:tyrosinase